MKQPLRAVAGVVAASLLAACAVGVPPKTKAARIEQSQCADARSAPDDVRLLQTTTVLKAEPIYSRIHTNTSEEDRVSGTKLLIRPPDGVSADRLAQVLRCHSARILLGQVDRSMVMDDPYWLPDAWLDIDVTPEAGNYAVTLRADSVAKNLKVLNRASAFAETHRSEATP